MNSTFKITKIREVNSPEKNEVGFDFYIPEDFNNGEPYELLKGQDIVVNSGISTSLPENTVLIPINNFDITTSRYALAAAGINYEWSTPESSLVASVKISNDLQNEILFNIVNIGPRTTLILPGQKFIRLALVTVNDFIVEE